MSREDQRHIVQVQREELIKELIATYSNAFDRLPSLDLPERTLAKLAQLIINAREAAIQVMEEVIEAPLIISSPNASSLERREIPQENSLNE